MIEQRYHQTNHILGALQNNREFSKRHGRITELEDVWGVLKKLKWSVGRSMPQVSPYVVMLARFEKKTGLKKRTYKECGEIFSVSPQTYQRWMYKIQLMISLEIQRRTWRREEKSRS